MHNIIYVIHNLFQTAAESSLTKQVTEFKANEEFVDVDVVEERFKDKPE